MPHTIDEQFNMLIADFRHSMKGKLTEETKEKLISLYTEAFAQILKPIPLFLRKAYQDRIDSVIKGN